MTDAVLFVSALVASTLSGAVGMGGGTLLIAVIAAILPNQLVVPLHGVVQLVSNGSRAAFLLRNVRWTLFWLYVPAQFAGVAVAISLYRGSPLDWLRPAIGAFVIAYLLWDRFRPPRLQLPRWAFVPAGFGGGMLAILIGAMGPYLSALFLRDDLEREEIVATKAAIQTAGHLAKIPAFMAVGFVYLDHLTTLVPLILAAIVGSYLGTRLLRRMDARIFALLFRFALGALALRLLLA